VNGNSLKVPIRCVGRTFAGERLTGIFNIPVPSSLLY
jgi:hypothetical protein